MNRVVALNMKRGLKFDEKSLGDGEPLFVAPEGFVAGSDKNIVDCGQGRIEQVEVQNFPCCKGGDTIKVFRTEIEDLLPFTGNKEWKAVGAAYNRTVTIKEAYPIFKEGTTLR